MAEVPPGANKYAGNSNRDKEADVGPAKKVDKVVEGAVIERKKPLGRRIAENFAGADAHSVGQYVLFQVILPQLKDMIFDVGSSALQRALFGESSGRSYSSSAKKGWTPYSNQGNQAVSKVQQAAAKPQQAASNEFGEIVLPDRGDAQNVMDRMQNLIETYGMASVSDLKAAVGLTGNFVDEKFGWTAMGGTDIRRVGGQNPGFLLIFPRPEELP